MKEVEDMELYRRKTTSNAHYYPDEEPCVENALCQRMWSQCTVRGFMWKIWKYVSLLQKDFNRLEKKSEKNRDWKPILSFNHLFASKKKKRKLYKHHYTQITLTEPQKKTLHLDSISVNNGWHGKGAASWKDIFQWQPRSAQTLCRSAVTFTPELPQCVEPYVQTPIYRSLSRSCSVEPYMQILIYRSSAEVVA